MFLGDSHGNTRSVIDSIDQAAAGGVELIIQLGRFRLQPHAIAYDTGPLRCAFVDAVTDHLNNANIDLVFVRGNHEHQTYLRAERGTRSGQPCRERSRSRLSCPSPIAGLEREQSAYFVVRG